MGGEYLGTLTIARSRFDCRRRGVDHLALLDAGLPLALFLIGQYTGLLQPKPRHPPSLSGTARAAAPVGITSSKSTLLAEISLLVVVEPNQDGRSVSEVYEAHALYWSHGGMVGRIEN
jgi:hypothetical protein